jgi:hypothetical protein
MEQPKIRTEIEDRIQQTPIEEEQMGTESVEEVNRTLGRTE